MKISSKEMTTMVKRTLIWMMMTRVRLLKKVMTTKSSSRLISMLPITKNQRSKKREQKKTRPKSSSRISGC